jgi:hypothetical protein
VVPVVTAFLALVPANADTRQLPTRPRRQTVRPPRAGQPAAGAGRCYFLPLWYDRRFTCPAMLPSEAERSARARVAASSARIQDTAHHQVHTTSGRPGCSPAAADINSGQIHHCVGWSPSTAASSAAASQPFRTASRSATDRPVALPGCLSGATVTGHPRDASGPAASCCRLGTPTQHAAYALGRDLDAHRVVRTHAVVAPRP